MIDEKEAVEQQEENELITDVVPAGMLITMFQMQSDNVGLAMATGFLLGTLTEGKVHLLDGSDRVTDLIKGKALKTSGTIQTGAVSYEIVDDELYEPEEDGE